MMAEQLSGCDFVPFSVPIESNWLNRLANESHAVIVGDGVTAKEYFHILHRLKYSFEVISTKSVINDPGVCMNGFVILACPQSRVEISDILDRLGLVKGKNYESFYKLLRNRAVFDFRGSFRFKREKWLSTIRSLSSMATLGGVDILIDSDNLSNLSSAVGEDIQSLKHDYHIKLSIELIGELDFRPVEGLRADLLEIVVRENQVAFFDPDGLNELVSGRGVDSAHVMCVGHDTRFASAKFSSEVQGVHPQYYDAMLGNHLNRIVSTEGDNRHCVSRRMYPVFDNRLNLKLCSLYDVPAQTDFDYSDIGAAEYIASRNRLCAKCKNKGLHRWSGASD